MLKKYNYEEKNLEKALEKFKSELELTEEDVLYFEKEVKGGLLKSNKVMLTVIKKGDIKNLIIEYIQTLAKYLEIKIENEIVITEESIKINLTSNDSSALIGKNGKMLNSIQMLLKKHLEIQTEMPLKVYLDVENYKERKIENLERNIKRIIKEVLNTKVDVKLDPMNSYERRIVHNLVSEYENLSSESEGEAPNRCVVIKYIER